MTLRNYIPWWAKICAKIVLSRTPIRYRTWRRLGFFVHGNMDSPEYAYEVVTSHLRRTGIDDLRDFVERRYTPEDIVADPRVRPDSLIKFLLLTGLVQDVIGYADHAQIV